MFNKIALVGGTHGNETSGIQLIRNWQAFGLPSRFSTLNVSLNIANEAALEANPAVGLAMVAPNSGRPTAHWNGEKNSE